MSLGGNSLSEVQWNQPWICIKLHVYVCYIVILLVSNSYWLPSDYYLQAASLFKGPVPPVVPFSLGSLGFMTPFRILHFYQKVSISLINWNWYAGHTLGSFRWSFTEKIIFSWIHVKVIFNTLQILNSTENALIRS